MPVARNKGQTPLREALLFEAGASSGQYVLQITPSVCFGVVTLGGFVVSFIHEAAVDFVSKIPKDHCHVRQAFVQFFRPVLPKPKEVHLDISVVNASKLWTTVKVDVTQNKKLCITGFMTLTNLSLPGQISVKTGWKLSPLPAPILSLEALEADMDPRWVSYVLPFHPKIFRRPQAYMKYYLPVIQHPSLSLVDHWVTPAWVDDEAPNGAVWTDALVHFAIDNVLPLLNDLVDQDAKISLHQRTVNAGLAQRQARLEGRDDRIVGEGLRDDQLLPLIISTMSISTEIFKPLPPEGTKWLFLRAVTKSVMHDRTDYDVYLMDKNYELVASSQQTMVIVPYQQKKAKPAL